ncbi:MAG: 1-deoxy-D-xylulose-5-phosphate reductoisomerase [Hyphomicrobiales bacterium]|nr:1-deoxy-D-xylulose-5-phosphate reductoisomerase [Hyphomicrobiales bacterium]
MSGLMKARPARNAVSMKPAMHEGDARPGVVGEPKRLTILGATGSIGQSTAAVVEAVPGSFTVEALAAGSDAPALAAMARRLNARCAVIADDSRYAQLRDLLSGSGIEVAAGAEALKEAAMRPADMVIGAITGAAGVEPTFAALQTGRTVGLANKECLVCAGAPFMQAANALGVTILPVDSEHNAIFQALSGKDASQIDRMVLTASGGPFRTWTAAAIAAATPEQALAHPNWDMGPKVTIDSASLMNKGLELIEAHFLFGVDAERLGVLVHPQSIVHGLVTYSDGSMVAGLANPDMKVPIAHCLGWPARLNTGVKPVDLAEIASLTFERPDFSRFPALGVAMDAMRQGGAMPTVLNAANEIAVAMFLDRIIGFSDIARVVGETCERILARSSATAPVTVSEALSVDHNAREIARTILA